MIAACGRSQPGERFSVQQRSTHEKRTVRRREGVHEREQSTREKLSAQEETAPKRPYCAREKTARKGNDLRSRKACGSNEHRELMSNLVVAGCMRSAIGP